MSKESRDEPVRKPRTPVASNRAPLVYRGQDTKNFSYRWVLDRDDRIAQFVEAGYEFAKPNGSAVGDPSIKTQEQDGSRVTKSAGFGGLKHILMRIPIKFYNEDQAAKQREVDSLEDSMRRPGTGKIVGKDVDYGSIKMDRGAMPALDQSDDK